MMGRMHFARSILLTWFIFSGILSLAQERDEEAFLTELKEKIDISTLKENPIVSYSESDSLFNSLNHFSDSSFKARFFNLLGELNFEKGDYALALEYFITAQDFAKNQKKSTLNVKLLIDIGNIFYKNKDLKSALVQYEKARNLAIEIQSQKLAATAANNIGLLHLQSKRYEDAEFYFKEGLSYRRQLNDQYLVAHSLQYLGMLNFHQNKLDSAQLYYQKALNLSKSAKETEKALKLQVGVLTDLSSTLLRKRDSVKAQKTIQEASIILSTIDNPYFFCASTYQLASIYYKLKNQQACISSCLSIIETAGLENYFALQQKAYALLSKVEEDRGNYQKAVKLSRKSEHIKSKIRENYTDKKLANDRYAQQVIGSKKLLELAKRESELKSRELESQQRINELLVLLVIIGLIALISLIIRNRERKKSNKQLIATNHLIEKQNVAIKKSQEEVEAASRKLEEKIEQLEQLTKDKNQLISIVAHDLRTPLSSIRGLSELLSVDVKELNLETNSEIIEHIEMINFLSDNMLDMTEQILNSQSIETHRENLNKVQFNLVSEINQTLKKYEKWAYEKEITIDTSKANPNLVLSTNRNLFDHILSNLISNAIKYSPKGKTIEIGCKEHQEFIEVHIKDQGPGFSAADKAKLFEPHQKLSASPTNGEESFGVGLSSVKKLCHIINAQIKLESEQGNGATFIIQLPKT